MLAGSIPSGEEGKETFDPASSGKPKQQRESKEKPQPKVRINHRRVDPDEAQRKAAAVFQHAMVVPPDVRKKIWSEADKKYVLLCAQANTPLENTRVSAFLVYRNKAAGGRVLADD